MFVSELGACVCVVKPPEAGEVLDDDEPAAAEGVSEAKGLAPLVPTPSSPFVVIFESPSFELGDLSVGPAFAVVLICVVDGCASADVGFTVLG